jgi:hypothetical protein
MVSAKTIVLVCMLSANFFSMHTAYAVADLVRVSAEALYSKDKNNALWGVSGVLGDGQTVLKFTGKPGQFKANRYSGTFVPHLRAKASFNDHHADGYIDNIWPLPDGTVLFAASVNGKNYLYKLNPKTNTVGNNKPGKNAAGYNNRQAVMNIGQRGKVHFNDIKALNQRSLLITTDKGKPPVLFFGEYNDGANRVDGKPGDDVVLWKSTDMGDSWIKVIQWNTKGHQTDHIHGIKQNPYNGWIYILFGDDNNEPGIVAWDGKAVAPPDNTAIGDIRHYKGWKSIAGSQAVRTGDIVFTKDKCLWLPDIDYLNKNPNTNGEPLHIHGQQADHDLSHLMINSIVPYQNNITPILGYIDTDGTVYWASFRSQGTAEKKLYLWSSVDFGITWALSKVNIYNAWTSMPANLFVAPWGEVVLSGRATLFVKNQKTSTGYSAYFKPRKRS